MRIAFTTLGCKLNYAETSTYERGFISAGWELVPWTREADVYLVNTCSVTETAEKKSRNLIRRAHKTSPAARIVVTGCYAELRKEQLLQIEGVWKVFGNKDKKSLVYDVIAGMTVMDGTLSGNNTTPGSEGGTLGAFSSGERTRSFLKVQDGCDNFCAYCTVPYARGRSRSVPAEQVLAMAREIASKGIKEIVLTGVNTGDYGRDTGVPFLELLKQLNAVDGIDRYRISSIEPNLITPEMIDWIASGTKFQKHFHIPLQSGSDTLLGKVGRRYDTELFRSRIKYIRSAMERPGESKVFFGIDVIAGLPSETEELFMETYHFLEDVIRPAFIHVFPYSRRPGTPAATWPGQVQESVKTERVARLEALCEDLHTAFTAANKGCKETVLWESSVKNGLMGGYTGNYLRIQTPYNKDLVNTIQPIVIQ